MSPQMNISESPRLPIALLGVAFDNFTMNQAIAEIDRMIASGRPHYVVTANVDFLAQACGDVELRRILFDAHLVLCDGTPLLWASSWLGNRLVERVAGADLVPRLIHAAALKQHRIFFLGATPDSAAQAVDRLRRKYPEAIIAGHYSPPFRALLEMDHAEITRRITEAKPDLLFVSFGCPKAEKWMAMHYRSLGVPVAIGVGATIDFLAGRVRRAPEWMRRSGTEWIFRLAQEPRRLMRRYARDLGFFAWSVLAQWCRVNAARSHPSVLSDPPGSIPTSGPATSGWRVLKAPSHFDAHTLRVHPELCAEPSADLDLVLDLSGVERLDSTGAGVLVNWHKQLRQNERRLVLLAPAPIVTRVLKFMRLQDFFFSAANLAAAEKLLAPEGAEDPLEGFKPDPGTEGGGLRWRGEITAANAEHVWEAVRAVLSTLRDRLVIDLSGVPYIDSSGLGLLVRAKKLAQSRGAELKLIGLQPAVRNVLRLSRLEEYLLGMTAHAGA